MDRHNPNSFDSLQTSLWQQRVGLGAACESWIKTITATYLAVGLVALLDWQVTGKAFWVNEFFGVPAALLMVGLALTEFYLAFLVIRHFAPDDVLRPGWTLIAGSAACQVLGTIFSQVSGLYSRINPLAGGSGRPEFLIPLGTSYRPYDRGHLSVRSVGSGVALRVKGLPASGDGDSFGASRSGFVAGFLRLCGTVCRRGHRRSAQRQHARDLGGVGLAGRPSAPVPSLSGATLVSLHNSNERRFHR